MIFRHRNATDRILGKLFELDCLKAHPPVLFDIGASGQLHPEWSSIASYSVAFGFDADAREFDSKQNKHGFKKLILINKVLTDGESSDTRFYLTKSPYCSSVLEPDLDSLQRWKFSGLFETENNLTLPAVNLNQIMASHGISQIDWFKTDSQGIDLRLFRSLPTNVQNKILVAEFEPGFIDAYKGEDKIQDILSYMEKMPFWLSDCDVKGTQRISALSMQTFGVENKITGLRNSACWAELCYLNTLEKEPEERDLFLGWIFSTLKGQHGFALDILIKLEKFTEGRLFSEMLEFSKSMLMKKYRVLRKRLYS